MGLSKATHAKARHILWCDTEGGVRGVPLWDVTFIDETHDTVRAHRFSSLQLAPRRSRAQLRRELPQEVTQHSQKSGSTGVVEYALTSGKWEPVAHTNVSLPLHAVIKPYLASRAGSALIAWNLRGHDQHVLTRAVGDKVMHNLLLWDALPWFRAKYTLPKNTMASNKAGTPRNVFNVPTYGSAHGSLADAAHMRDVVLRASYCWQQKNGADVTAHENSSRVEQLDTVYVELENTASDNEWRAVACGAWTTGLIPDAIYKDSQLDAKSQPVQSLIKK